MAALMGRVETARHLPARGADKTLRDEDGKLAADLAKDPVLNALLA